MNLPRNKINMMNAISWMFGWNAPAISASQRATLKQLATDAADTVQKAEPYVQGSLPKGGPADWAYWQYLLTKTAPLNLCEHQRNFNYFDADGGPERAPDWAIEQYLFLAELRDVTTRIRHDIPERQMPDWVRTEFIEVAEQRRGNRHRSRCKTSPIFVPMNTKKTFVDCLL